MRLGEVNSLAPKAPSTEVSKGEVSRDDDTMRTEPHDAAGDIEGSNIEIRSDAPNHDQQQAEKLLDGNGKFDVDADENGLNSVAAKNSDDDRNVGLEDAHEDLTGHADPNLIAEDERKEDIEKVAAHGEDAAIKIQSITRSWLARLKITEVLIMQRRLLKLRDAVKDETALLHSLQEESTSFIKLKERLRDAEDTIIGADQMMLEKDKEIKALKESNASLKSKLKETKDGELRKMQLKTERLQAQLDMSEKMVTELLNRSPGYAGVARARARKKASLARENRAGAHGNAFRRPEDGRHKGKGHIAFGRGTYDIGSRTNWKNVTEENNEDTGKMHIENQGDPVYFVRSGKALRI